MLVFHHEFLKVDEILDCTFCLTSVSSVITAGCFPRLKSVGFNHPVN